MIRNRKSKMKHRDTNKHKPGENYVNYRLWCYWCAGCFRLVIGDSFVVTRMILNTKKTRTKNGDDNNFDGEEVEFKKKIRVYMYIKIGPWKMVENYKINSVH